MKEEFIHGNSVNNKKIFFTEISLLKGLATLIVVAIHTVYVLTPDFLFFYTCAVPIFFFLSGLTLTLRYQDNLDLHVFYKKRFRYLLPAYLFWTFLLVFKGVFTGNQPIQVYIVRYIIIIFTGDIMTLYFLICIFEFYLFFPFILRFMKKLKIRTSLLLFLLMVFLYLIVYLFSINFNILFLKSRIVIYSFEIDSSLIEINIAKLYFIVFMIPFSLLGIVFGLNYDLIRDLLKRRSIFCYISIIYVFLAVFFYFYKIPYRNKGLFDYNNYLNFVTLFFTFISILFYLAIFIRFNNSLLNFIGILSAGIYLSHRIIMTIFSTFFNLIIDFNIENLFYGIPYYILIILGSILVVLIIKKIPKSEYLILI